MFGVLHAFLTLSAMAASGNQSGMRRGRRELGINNSLGAEEPKHSRFEADACGEDDESATCGQAVQVELVVICIPARLINI